MYIYSDTANMKPLSQRRSSLKFNRMSSTMTGLLFLLVCIGSHVSAERDFNLNDSQVPVIEPKDVPAYQQDPYVTELMRCEQSPNEIVLSLVLKQHDWNELSAAKRAHVQSKLAKFFAIPKEFIALDSIRRHDLQSMQKTAMRKGGKLQKGWETTNRRLGRASFMIGCGANYFDMGEPIVKQIAHQVKDGTIGAITEENFGTWYIWRKELRPRSQRKRRDTEGSAPEDDYEYDYGEEETPEPVTTTPAPTHAHRHHHGVTDNISAGAGAVPAVEVTAPAPPNSPTIVESRPNSLDEEIEESVSKLESVISKTIENTKNIKELSVLSVDDDADEDVDLEQLGKTHAVGVPAVPQIVETDKMLVEEFDNELDVIKADTATPSIASTTSATVNPSLFDAAPNMNSNSNNIINKNNNNDDDDDDGVQDTVVVAVTAANVEDHMATSTLLTTNQDIIATPATPKSASVHAHSTQPNSIENNNNISNNSKQSPSFSPYDANSSVSVPSIATTIETIETTSTPSLPSLSSAAGTSIPVSTITTSTTTSATMNTTPSTISVTESVTVSNNNNNNNNTTFTTATTATLPSSTTSTTATQSQSPKEEDANAIDASNNSSVSAGQDSTATISVSTTTPHVPVASIEVSSTTFASTDYVEPHNENSAPIIKTRLQKLAVTSGKAFTFLVPEDTFFDTEDLKNLRLELTDKDGQELKHNSWLQFNAEKRELYGLPLDDTVSRWQYRLTATDSGNESVTETVEISVQQHRGVRTINHEINIAVRINEKHLKNIDWQLKLIHGIARTLEDGNSAALVVREIRQVPQDPHSATFVYFNETLPTTECPEAELNDIVRRLDAQRLSDLVQPLLGIKSITGQLIGSCLKTELTKPKPTMHMSKNLPPMPRNQVDRVNASVGQLLVYRVPIDTFYDPNDNELTLTLKTKDHKELGTRHWLQFDSKNQEFYGIPKSGDLGSDEYLLVAEDSGGLSATDALVVVVSHAPKKEFSVFFKAYLAIRHENFNADLQRKFVERIAQLHGDSNTNQIQVRSITTHHDSDGTIVNFYNTSLYKSHNRCPDKEMAITRSVYLTSDMMLRESVKKLLGPELNLTNLSVAPFGACHQTMDINQHEYIPTRTEEPGLKSTFSEEYLATFILPAVIILVMILLASIIACCLHRRRHKSGKMELGDEEERKSFRTKGIPVIFQDEFDEKPEIGNKSPVILKDEKPPLMPPSYNTSNLIGDNDVDEYVPPPAVVVGGREIRGKSPATPSYRKPPPYVSP
ncbi:uncharacterized protein LOC115623622 isoform X1 [Scaptodrosophila lebanonensis]|uniref:Dystroglycan 1 n=1 Tax=Drosophila lebanonensis TaxID=7225 RepID=A0A6J2TAQ5_DROLE|nr:uncharacterized protein LOC115623622 isoform X1 [Scaptodrosophila lebanonensis]